MNGKKSKAKPIALIVTIVAVVAAIAATADSFTFISCFLPSRDVDDEVTETQTVYESTSGEKLSGETQSITAKIETTSKVKKTCRETSTQAQTTTKRGIKLPEWTYPQRTQDASYFDDAIFVGDSRLEDFVMYMELPKENCYADVGLSVTSAFTKQFVAVGNKKLTAIDAVSQNKTFKKAYLMFGFNELGWPYPKEFIKEYAKVIDAVLQANPNAVVYVQSILPVTAEHDAEYGEENNGKIHEMNLLIEQLAKEKNVVYLDVSGALQDENGCLPAYAARDGVHLGKTLCKRWYEYLLSNTVKNTFFG